MLPQVVVCGIDNSAIEIEESKKSKKSINLQPLSHSTSARVSVVIVAGVFVAINQSTGGLLLQNTYAPYIYSCTYVHKVICALYVRLYSVVVVVVVVVMAYCVQFTWEKRTLAKLPAKVIHGFCFVRWLIAFILTTNVRYVLIY